MKNSELVKVDFMEKLKGFLEESGEEVLTVKSGAFSIPWAKGEDEGFLNITFSIPKGERGGAGYDGYEEARNFEFELETKAKAKAEAEVKKQKKIERDTKLREEKARLKALKAAEVEEQTGSKKRKTPFQEPFF